MQRLHSPASTSVGRLPCTDRPALQSPAVRQASTALPTLRLAAVVTDQAVPEGHKGLHGFLYGEAGAEVHDQQSQYHFRQGQDEGQELTPVASYLGERERDTARGVGVYALYNDRQQLQYVGYARNVAGAIQAHLGRVGPAACNLTCCLLSSTEAGTKAHLGRVGPAACSFARVLVIRNRAMTTRQSLETIAAEWLREAGEKPPGNASQQQLWEGLAASNDYEDKKLKMRKAMGESLHDAPVNESESAEERRLNTIRAVEGDDWSAVIDRQTQEATQSIPPGVRDRLPSDAPESPHSPDDVTAPRGDPRGEQPLIPEGPPEGPRRSPPESPPVTPFANARVHRTVGEGSDGSREMSLPAVDSALDDVRPYLMADGGNVTVVEVADGIVRLRLEGACGTCASSTSTMKMGIERALQAAFGAQLKSVEQVDTIDTRATLAAVDSHLDQLRPAIKSYGGQVKVLHVEDGICKVHYEGPAPIGMGIQAAIKDKFPDIRLVQGC